MQLKDIIKNLEIVETIGDIDVSVTCVRIDSRLVSKNDVFIALKGTQADGHQFIPKAIALGASVIVCEDIPEEIAPTTCYLKVKDSAKAVGILAGNFYQNPSENIALIGITGTNGKTTSATLLYRLFKHLGYKVGLISTIKNIINEKKNSFYTYYPRCYRH